MPSEGSRLPGFHRLSIAERRALVDRCCACAHESVTQKATTTLPLSSWDALAGGGLDLETADTLVENVVGTYALPLGVATNFTVNGRDALLPMCTEEPSVIAAASNAARMVREGGGFFAQVDASIVRAQIQLLDVADPDAARARILQERPVVLALAQTGVPGLCARGGGAKDLLVRILSRPEESDGGMLVVDIDVDVRDAMGANMVNTVAEIVAPLLAQLAGGNARAGLRILSNLSDARRVKVTARVPVAALSKRGQSDGSLVACRIVEASRFAELDPYRAATHNKGIMNGVDAVLLATGQDFRGVEAGAHAFAARSGTYAPLAIWRVDGDFLRGALDMPMALGTVGGALRAHPAARFNLGLTGVRTAGEFAALVAAAGLASNLAALRALATEGIQRGHMALHSRATSVNTAPSSTAPTGSSLPAALPASARAPIFHEASK